MGCSTGLVRPPVPNSKTGSRRKQKFVWTKVSERRSNRCANYQLKRSKVKVTGGQKPPENEALGWHICSNLPQVDAVCSRDRQRLNSTGHCCVAVNSALTSTSGPALRRCCSGTARRMTLASCTTSHCSASTRNRVGTTQWSGASIPPPQRREATSPQVTPTSPI